MSVLCQTTCEERATPLVQPRSDALIPVRAKHKLQEDVASRTLTALLELTLEGIRAADRRMPLRSRRLAVDAHFLRLLLLEENPIDARVIGEHLTYAADVHIELEHLDRLSAGLARLSETRFDAVLADLNLPDSSGPATLTQIHDRNPEVPIVVLTGLDPHEFGLQAINAGAEDYLAKDELEPKLLIRTIRYAIERARHRCADQQYRDRSEKKLRESEQRYRELLGAITTYTYSVTFVNQRPAATQHSAGCLGATGFSPQDFAADPYLWFRMIHPDDRPRVQQYLAEILDGATTRPIEHRIFHRNGALRWIRNTIIQRRDEAGRLVGYDGLVADITERKAAEQALRDRESQLLATEAIQARLWPKAPPVLPGFDIAGACCPAEFAAGDYFDYVPMTDGSLGLLVGDVSGHGLGAALVMALTYAHVRSLAQIYSEPSEILTRVNRFLIDETDHFVTLLFARVYGDTRSFCWINAGHPPGFILGPANDVKARLEATTTPLAVLTNPTFSAGGPVTLASGDIVLLITDGILEARSPDDVQFGAERVLEVVATNRDKTAREIIEAITCSVRTFCAPDKPTDDMTAMAIKVRSDSDG